MAENIGSLEVDVSITNVNVEQVTKQIADELNKVKAATDGMAAAMDDAEDSIKDCTKKMAKSTDDAAKSTDDLADAADAAASEIKEVGKILSDIADAADTAADAAKELTDNLDPNAAKVFADEMQKVAESEVTTATAAEEVADATKRQNEETQNLSSNLSKVFEEINNVISAETDRAEKYVEINKHIKELTENQDAMGKISPELKKQIENLQDYTNQLQTLIAEQERMSIAGETSNKTYEENAAKIDGLKSKISGITKSTQSATTATTAQNTMWNILGKTLGVTVPAGATATRFAIEAVKTAMSAGLLTVITLVSEWLTKLFDKLTFSFKLQSQLNEKVSESTAETVANLKLLQAQWNDLGDDLQAKEKFIESNKSKFDELGVSVQTVADAENLLVTNTNAYVTAMMARAKATAAQDIMQDNMKDKLKDLAEAETEYNKNKNLLLDAQKKYDELHAKLNDNKNNAAFISEYNRAADNLNIINQKIKKYSNKSNEINAEIEKDNAKFIKIIMGSNKEAEDALKAANITLISKDFENQIAERKKAYKQYAADLKSTDDEIRQNAATNNKINLADGKTFLEYLKKRREEVKGNAQQLAIINKEISALTQPTKATSSTTKATPDKEELTYYQQLKAELQEVNAQKEKGFKPDPQIVESLEKEIKAYEERNGLIEPPTVDYSEKIAKYKEFAKKLVALQAAAEKQKDEIFNNENLTPEENNKAQGDIDKFLNADIELLKEQYGIVGDDLANAILSSMENALTEGAPDIAARMIQIQQEIANLTEGLGATDEYGNAVDNSEKIAALTAELETLKNKYNDAKQAIKNLGKEKKATDKELKKAEIKQLLTSIQNLGDGFSSLGQQIGGAAGESLQFIGSLTTNITSTISMIRNYGEMASQEIQGVSKSVGTAIKAVETASVILAVISAAMEIAMKIIQLFQKDEETYEDRKEVYQAYIETVDKVIDREKELIATMTDTQEIMRETTKIAELYDKQEESTRRIAQDYLLQGTKGKKKNRGHTVGYEIGAKMTAADYQELRNAGIFGINNANDLKNNLFSLTADEIRKMQESAIGFYSKLDAETRGYLDEIAKIDEARANLDAEAAEAITGVSFDSMKDNFKSALMDMDVTAEQLGETISDTIHEKLISNLVDDELSDDLKKVYDYYRDAMADNKITEEEMRRLNQLKDDATQKAIRRKESIDALFKEEQEELEEDGGLAGAIKGASQESIDLLTGQTNAVRMNQVAAMELARQQLSASLAISSNVALCANYLSSIKTSLDNSGNLRAQGIM